MGDMWVDYACARCGEFLEGHTCNTEEELKEYEDKNFKDKVFYCAHCRTFTDLYNTKEVKVIFPSYGTYRGWKELFEGLVLYI